MMLKLPRLTMNEKPYYMVEVSEIDKFELSDSEKNDTIDMSFDGINYKLVPIYTPIDEMSADEKEQEINKLRATIAQKMEERKKLEKEKEMLERKNKKLEENMASGWWLSPSPGGCSSPSSGGCSSSSYGGGCSSSGSYRGGC